MWWRLVIDYPRMSFDNCRSQGVVAYPNSHEEDYEALRIFETLLGGRAPRFGWLGSKLCSGRTGN